MSKRILILILISFSFSFSCSDYDDEINDLQNEIESLKYIQNLLELKNVLLNAISSEILVKQISEDSENVFLYFENNFTYKFPKKLLNTYNKIENDWHLKMTLSDSTEFNLFYIGTPFDFNELKLDPFNIAPLSLLIKKETPVNGMFKVRVIGQDGSNSDFIIDSNKFTKNHSLEIFGLYPDYENQIEISFLNKNGIVRTSSILSVKTNKLPDNLPDFNIEKQYSNYDQNTLILVNYRPAFIPFMVDPYGKIRWYLNGNAAVNKYGLQRFKNGNIGFGVSGNGQGKIHEYSIMGELIKTFDFYPKYENAHHDVFEMSNGNFLVAVNKVGISTVEDFIIEIDRNTGTIGNVWDLRDILPMDRYDLRKIGDGSDWFHVNAIIHDESDNSIIVSGQTQGTIKTSWENELKWILAPHKGWDDQYKEYLLNPNSNDFEWSWGQHAPLILPNGNLLQFDNGFGRDFENSSSPYSRIVEYEINDDSVGGNISQIWQYGKERGEEMFAPFISDVDYLKNSSTYFITAGSTAFDLIYEPGGNGKFNRNNDQIETRIIEVNRNKEILFEMTLSSPIMGTTYRSEKLIFN